MARRYKLGAKQGRDWLFNLEEIEFLDSIDPRGGKPRENGQPCEYSADLANQARKGPQA